MLNRTEGNTTTNTSDHDAAAQLAERIKNTLVDPSKVDEADRPPSDKPPAYAQVLMSEAPPSPESAAQLTAADWELIWNALEHCAACDGG